MESKEQLAILKARTAVLAIVDSPNGTLTDRLQAAQRDIKILGAAIAKWVDATAVIYQKQGYELVEWREDIRSWFVAKQFFVDDDTNDDTMMRCHLSNVGWGRHVILSFRLATKSKGNKT